MSNPVRALWRRFIQPVQSQSPLLRADFNHCPCQRKVPFSSPFLHTSQFGEDEATVSQTIFPFRSGRVRFQGSWWYARCTQAITLETGTVVRVVGTFNTTLLVEPFSLMSQLTQP